MTFEEEYQNSNFNNDEEEEKDKPNRVVADRLFIKNYTIERIKGGRA